MKKGSGGTILFLLILILIVQVYIMIFDDPVSISRKALAESKILLQGKDPGVPESKPADKSQARETVAEIGPKEQPVIKGARRREQRPVVPFVAHGRDQSEPKTPLSVRPQGPLVPGMVRDIKTAKVSADAVETEKVYKAVIYGILILEENEKLALTREQALKLKKALDMMNRVQSAVPDARKAILENLTDEQLKEIYRLMCLRRGGSQPLSPETMDGNSAELRGILQKRR